MKIITSGTVILIFFSILSGNLYSQAENTEQLVNKLKSEKIDSVRTELMLQISEEYLYKNFDSAYNYAIKAKILSEKISSEKLGGKSSLLLGKILWIKGKYADAENEVQNAAAIFKNIEDNRNLANCEKQNGIIYQTRGNYIAAYKKYLIALNLMKQYGDEKDVISCKNNVAIIKMITGDLYSAINYFRNNLNYLEKNNLDFEIAMTMINLAKTHELTKKNNNNSYSGFYYDSALTYYYSAFQILEKTNNLYGMAITNLNIANVYYKLANYNDAEQFYNKSIDLALKYGDTITLAKNYTGMGSVNRKLKNFDTAKEYYDKSFRIFNEIQDTILLSDVYYNFSLLYEESGDQENAYKNYKLYYSMTDSLKNIQTHKELLLLIEQYDKEEAENEILKLTEENKLKKDEIDQQEYYMFAIISAAIILFVLLIGKVISGRRK